MNPQTGGAKISDALSRTQETAIQFEGAEASAALAKAAAWLAKLGQTRGFTLEQRYVSIDLVDTATRQHQQRALDDYLALPPAQRVQEKLLWEAAHGFWAALSGAYVDCITAAQADADAAAKLGVKLPLLAARGARAIALQIKWLAFRYALVEPWVWSNLARCLLFAEANDVAGKAAPLYRSDAGPISTEQAFLRAVMLQVSDTESLSPMEQEMVSRLIDHFSSDFKLDRRAQEDLTHYFDLDHALPPRRVLGAPGKAARRRYLGALDTLQRIRYYLELARGASPASLAFAIPKGGELKQVIKVLDHLAIHWGKPLPSRAFARRLTAACMDIRHDYREVREALHDGLVDVSAAAQAARGETWVVDNAGRGGYGAIVPRGQRPWLQLGVLIALRLEHEKSWSLGLIRRVETDEHRQRKVGIRVIARKPVAAVLRLLTQTPGRRSREEPGIVLNTRPSSNGGVHVLMRPGTFTLQDEIEAHFGADHAQALMLKPTNGVEATLDYAWVRYEVKR